MEGRRPGRGRSDAAVRLEVLKDLWARILDLWESRGSLSRDEVVAMLRGSYERAGLEPLRGKAVPEDIYDKEMASLYVVGKHGMGMEAQYPEIFDRVFYKEVRYEAAAKALLDGDPGVARAKVESILGSVSDNEIARMLRLKLTEVYFGFDSEESLFNLLRSIARVLPEKERVAVKYARFYAALMLARKISEGEVRNRLYKEAYKQAVALKLGLHGAIPDDAYVADIARGVFHVPERVLRSVLKLDGGRGQRGREAPRRQRGRQQRGGEGGG
ncbi:DUF2192 domain-containing protein [Stetteria hydrogenophila]